MLSFITNKKHNQKKEKNANTKTMKGKESFSHKQTQSIYTPSHTSPSILSYSECDVWKKNNGGGKEET